MLRALVLLVVPTVLRAADTDPVSPSCVHPATVEPRAPRKIGGDRIIFSRGTDWRSDAEILFQQYGLTASFAAEGWNVSVDGMFVAPLTAAQIAQLRCDPVVDRIVLGPLTPESFAQRNSSPRPTIRLGIAFAWAPAGESISNGLLVGSVEAGSVAERAGLRPGDRIIRFDEHETVFGGDLQRLVAAKKPGDTAAIVITRNGVQIPLVAQF